MFKINKNTTVDDVIEHLITRLNTDFEGSYIEINHFCHWDDSDNNYNYNKKMAALVLDKMLNFDIAIKANHGFDRVILRPNGIKAYMSGGWKKYLIEVEKLNIEKEKKMNRPNISVGGNAVIGDNNHNNHLSFENLESSHNSMNLEPTINVAQQKKDDPKTHKSTIFDKIYKWTDHKLISGIILLILGFFYPDFLFG